MARREKLTIDLSDEAEAELRDVVDLHRQRVLAMAKVVADDDAAAKQVEGSHVVRAGYRLRPAGDDGRKIAADWFKQVGFLLVGIAMPLIVNLFTIYNIDSTIDPWTFWWCLALTVIGLVLITLAVASDVPRIASARAAGRMRKEISGS